MDDHHNESSGDDRQHFIACKTYDSLTEAMERCMRINPSVATEVMMWMSEIPERNYDRMVDIATMLNEIDFETSEPQKKEFCTEMSRKIERHGAEINDEGGFTAMQAVYYTLKNFM